MEIYVVQPGDTVTSIARKYGISPQRIIYDNGISDPSALAVGQALLILPPEKVYTVRSGDTLYSIAEKSGTPVYELLRNNPYLSSQSYLQPGEVITLSYAVNRERSIRLSGFAYPHIRSRILEQILPYVTCMIIFGYGFSEDSSIIAPDDRHAAETSRKYGAEVLLSLSLIERDGHFDTAKLTPLLTDINFQNSVIDGMIREISSRGAQGMDIDMEYIPSYYKDDFIAFAGNAGRKLREQGYILNIDLAPKTSASQKGTLYEAHDYPALGAAADRVFLMTYEWGYQYLHTRYM